MNEITPAREARPRQRLAIVDCDIHVTPRSPAALHAHMPERWRRHAAEIGAHVRSGLFGQPPHPRMMEGGMRGDSQVPEGGPPGSSLAMLQGQHLDANGITWGMLIALGGGVFEERNQPYAAALSRAANDWQIAEFCEKDARLVAGVIAPQEDPDFAAREIVERAQDRRFRQVLISPRAVEPLGRRRYWPIYQAAEAAGLPVTFHPTATGGGHPTTPAGWPSYYMEEHNTFGPVAQAVIVSMIFEGVFDAFPGLKVVSVEGGFSWAPALGWRMDRVWRRMRAELPHLTRPPSEVMRDHVWFTTQPVDEPHVSSYLQDTLDWLGADRLMYSSDYPHWDFDSPDHTFRVPLADADRAAIFGGNAMALYGLK